jgi:hypothetical protein
MTQQVNFASNIHTYSADTNVLLKSMKSLRLLVPVLPLLAYC